MITHQAENQYGWSLPSHIFEFHTPTELTSTKTGNTKSTQIKSSRIFFSSPAGEWRNLYMRSTAGNQDRGLCVLLFLMMLNMRSTWRSTWRRIWKCTSWRSIVYKEAEAKKTLKLDCYLLTIEILSFRQWFICHFKMIIHQSLANVLNQNFAAIIGVSKNKKYLTQINFCQYRWRVKWAKVLTQTLKIQKIFKSILIMLERRIVLLGGRGKLITSW